MCECTDEKGKGRKSRGSKRSEADLDSSSEPRDTGDSKRGAESDTRRESNRRERTHPRTNEHRSLHVARRMRCRPQPVGEDVAFPPEQIVDSFAVVLEGKRACIDYSDELDHATVSHS